MIRFLKEVGIGDAQGDELWRAIVGFRSDRAEDESPVPKVEN
jgi:hypothetical protein